MAKYVHLFETVNEFNSARTPDNYVEPWLSYTKENSGLTFNKTEYEKLLETPLTFNIISAGTIVWKAQNTAYTTTIEYSMDSGSTWTSITSSKEGTSISVNPGDVIQFRGDNATYSSGSSRYSTFRASTAIFEAEGNIMSLIDSTGFSRATALQSAYTFVRLFSDCAGLMNVSNLILPASTLADYCYQYMFNGCTSLTTAPELLATTLASQCCFSMFTNCTGLTTAPELPATTLADYCYQNMFQACTSLNYIKCLATDISAGGCTYNWVSGVAATGTFIKNPSMTGWTTGINGIPSGWTVQDAS